MRYRICMAAEGCPLTDCGTRVPSSRVVQMNDVAAPPTMHSRGTTQRLVFR
jgi:hypothetical protein